MPYLFAHFKEKVIRDGEQIYFAVSKDGYNWESVNNGNPVIVCDKGNMGCRDIEIVRLHTGGFIILATDLCIVNHMDESYNVDWGYINTHGSKYLSMWRSDNLTEWSEQELLYFGRDDFGCLWAPEVFYDEDNEEYIVHWSSTVKENEYKNIGIYYSKTKDFITFTKPEPLFHTENGCIDSHIVKVGNTYHLFYKNFEPTMNMHATSENLFGKYEDDKDFERLMSGIKNAGAYEAATTYELPDGKWCMMLDFFGCAKDKMGYVPFISEKTGDAHFVRCDEKFTFPYGFKHGGVISITDDEYEKLLNTKF